MTVQAPAATAGRVAPLLAWGGNQSGQLGNDRFNEWETALQRVAVAGSPHAVIVDVSAGASHSLALTSDGKVYTWGHNSCGQLGLGTTTHRATPSVVAGIGSATDITAGALHSLAIADGNVYAWGLNSHGALGNGITVSSLGIPSSIPAPVTQPVPPLAAGTRFTRVAAGYQFGLALTSDGKVYAWGLNNLGQLGYSTAEMSSHTPRLVQGLDGLRINAVAAGERHGVALTADGQVCAWGRLGAASAGHLTTKVAGFEHTRVAAIAAGRAHTLALTLDDCVYAWGVNLFGQLGDCSTQRSSTPVRVQGLDHVKVQRLANGSSSDHSLAVTSEGVYAWGANYTGQLGDGTISPPTRPCTTPVLVSGTRPAPDAHAAIAAGAYHCLVAGCGSDRDPED